MIEPVKLHATLKPIQQLNGTLSAGVPIPGPPGPISQIQDEGIDVLPVRSTLNFTGDAVTVTDDAINAATVITVTGGGSQSPWTSDIDGAGFQLLNAGKVGIGTVTPQHPLHIYTETGNSAILLNNATTGSGIFNGTFLGLFGADVYLRSYEAASMFIGVNNSDQIVITAGQVDVSGNLNLSGHNLINAVDVRCQYLKLLDNTGTGGAQVDLLNYAGYFILRSGTGGTQNIVISPSANVGIGVDAPGYKLDVGGDVRASGAQIILTGLPSTNPGAGSKRLWYDPADSNRVKFAA